MYDINIEKSVQSHCGARGRIADRTAFPGSGPAVVYIPAGLVIKSALRCETRDGKYAEFSMSEAEES